MRILSISRHGQTFRYCCDASHPFQQQKKNKFSAEIPNRCQSITSAYFFINFKLAICCWICRRLTLQNPIKHQINWLIKYRKRNRQTCVKYGESTILIERVSKIWPPLRHIGIDSSSKRSGKWTNAFDTYAHCLCAVVIYLFGRVLCVRWSFVGLVWLMTV